MKVLGNAYGPDAGIIVEFNRRETDLLKTAQAAIEGSTSWEVFQNTSRPEDVQLDRLFMALTGWIHARLASNELKKCLELMTKATGAEYEARKLS